MYVLNRSPVGVYQVPRDELPAPGECHAIFPHGSLKPGIGVVSDRAIKHVHELVRTLRKVPLIFCPFFLSFFLSSNLK